MNRLWLTLLLLLVTAIWGWTFFVVKTAVDAYGVVGFLAVRFAIGSCTLCAVAPRRVPRKTWGLGAGIGVILAAAYLLQTFGLRTTSVTNCGLITGLFAIFALLVNRIAFGIHLRPVIWLAAGVSLAGLFLLTGAGPSPPTIGDGLTLGAALCFGLQIVLLDRYAKGHDTVALTLVQLAVATLIFAAIWPLVQAMTWPRREVWIALAITGVLATALAFYAQVLAQQHLPAVRAALLLSLEPVFAASFGYLLAGDQLTAVQLLGATLMVAAVMLAEAGRLWRSGRELSAAATTEADPS